jgi:hypothetical protein
MEWGCGLDGGPSSGSPSSAAVVGVGAMFAMFAPSSADHTAVRRCRLPAAVPGTPARMALWVKTLTGQELDEHVAVRALTEKERQHVRRRLDAMGGPPAP